MALTPSEDDCQPDYIKTDEEETPQEESIQNLDRLEDFAQRGKLKSPNWLLVILVVLMVWQVKFLCMNSNEFEGVGYLFWEKGSRVWHRGLNHAVLAPHTNIFVLVDCLLSIVCIQPTWESSRLRAKVQSET